MIKTIERMIVTSQRHRHLCSARCLWNSILLSSWLQSSTGQGMFLIVSPCFSFTSFLTATGRGTTGGRPAPVTLNLATTGSLGSFLFLCTSTSICWLVTLKVRLVRTLLLCSWSGGLAARFILVKTGMGRLGRPAVAPLQKGHFHLD